MTLMDGIGALPLNPPVRCGFPFFPGAGGHCLFEDSYPLPNYLPRLSGLSALDLSLTALFFWELQTTTIKNHNF